MTRATGKTRGVRLGIGAFTIVEAAVSTVIVGVMLVAALNAVGASRLGQCNVADSGRGQLLAKSLMAEILQQYYEEPDGTPRFGWEGEKENAQSRADYDDVDDYHEWSASPPQDTDDTVITGLDGWQRSVRIDWVGPFDFTQVSAFETGVKRISVTVTHNGKNTASMVAIRTNAWPSAEQ